MIPLHAAHGTALPPSARLSVGAVAGLAAALVATVVMWRQSHGYVPAYVAAAALLDDPPSEVPRSATHATHLTVGLLAGVTYEGALLGYARAEESAGIDAGNAVAASVTAAELAVGVLLVCVLYVVFSWVVFPSYGGTAYDVRPATVRRQWAATASVYGFALVVFVATVYAVLPA